MENREKTVYPPPFGRGSGGNGDRLEIESPYFLDF